MDEYERFMSRARARWRAKLKNGDLTLGFRELGHRAGMRIITARGENTATLIVPVRSACTAS